MLQDGHAIESDDLLGLLTAPESSFDSMSSLLNLSPTSQPVAGSTAFQASPSPPPVSKPPPSDPLIDVFFERCAHFTPFIPIKSLFETLDIAQSSALRSAMSLVASAFVSNGLAAAQAYRQSALSGVLSSPTDMTNVTERLATLMLICWFDYGDARPADSRQSLRTAVNQLVQSGALNQIAAGSAHRSVSSNTSPLDDMLLKVIHEIWATDVILQVSMGDRQSVLEGLKLAAPLPRDYAIGRLGEAPVQLFRLRALAILHFASGNEASPFHDMTLAGLSLDRPLESVKGVEMTIDNMLPVVQGAFGRLAGQISSASDAETASIIRREAESAFMATLMLLASKVFLVQRRTSPLNPDLADKCSTPAELDTVFAALDVNAPDALQPALDILSTIRDDLSRHGSGIPFHAPFFGCAHIVSSHAIVKYLVHVGTLPPSAAPSGSMPSSLQLSSSFDLLEESARRQSVTWPCATQSMKRLVAYRLASTSYCEWNNLVEFQQPMSSYASPLSPNVNPSNYMIL